MGVSIVRRMVFSKDLLPHGLLPGRKQGVAFAVGMNAGEVEAIGSRQCLSVDLSSTGDERLVVPVGSSELHSLFERVSQFDPGR